MRDGPNMMRIGALIGDPSRSVMLASLMSGQALTAGELARISGITAPTASSHLAQLIEGGLLRVEKQGRHRYFALAGADVAAALEALLGLAETSGHTPFQPGPRDAALRRARVCYDHLAGDFGVTLYQALHDGGAFMATADGIGLSGHGRAVMGDFGVDLAGLERHRRPLCKTCLDWSQRRHHLAGAAGAALLARLLGLRWLSRDTGQRALRVSLEGERAFPELLARLSAGQIPGALREG